MKRDNFLLFVWEHNDSSNIILQIHRRKEHRRKGLTLILSVKEREREMNLEGNCYSMIRDEDTCLSTKMFVNFKLTRRER